MKTYFDLMKENNGAKEEIERLLAERNDLAVDRVKLGVELTQTRLERDALVEKLRLACERGDVADAARDAATYEALGFAHAWCCHLLDVARDPRNVECGHLLIDWNAARKGEG
jgi:hypothetical protein